MFPLGLKDYAIIFIFFVIIGIGFKIYHDGEKNAVSTLTTKSLTEASDIKGKQDEIRNNRPADAANIKRLRRHRF